MNNRLYIVPYDFFGVKLFAVESDGYIHKYCDCRADAESYIKNREVMIVSDYRALIEVRHHFESARYSLEKSTEELQKTGEFKETIRKIDDNIDDLSKAINQLSLHLNEPQEQGE